MATIDRELIRETLILHARAYRLLIRLGDAARDEPDVLSPAHEAALANARTCAAWLAQHGDLFEPDALAGNLGRLAGLVSSFFHTSFHVARLEWDGRIVHAELRARPGHDGVRAAKRRRHGGSPTVEALARLCRDAGVRADSKALGRLSKDSSFRKDVHVWCYAVGLVQRSLGRSEGETDWEHWRSLPVEERKTLDADAVWAARERLLTRIAARGLEEDVVHEFRGESSGASRRLRSRAPGGTP